jgi:ketosteroid isomerase-like protein
MSLPQTLEAHRPSEDQAAADRIRSMFDCVDSQDWDGLAQCLHDQIVYERPGYDPLIGKPAVLEFYRRIRVVSAGRHSIDRVLTDGEFIACWGRFAGIAKDGRTLQVRFADVYGLEGTLIRSRRTFFDSPAI